MRKDRKTALALIALAIVTFGLVGASARSNDPTRAFYNLAHDRSVSVGQGITLLNLGIREHTLGELKPILQSACSESAGWAWPKDMVYPFILTRNGTAESLMLEHPSPGEIAVTYSRPTRWTDYTLTWRGWR